MMDCLTCKTQMECYDDVNDCYIRINWLECPKCGSKAEIQYGKYGKNGKYIEKVIWKR